MSQPTNDRAFMLLGRMFWHGLVMLLATLLPVQEALAAPSGYVEETVSGNKWTYPASAVAQVRDLQSQAQRSWGQVSEDLGVVLSSDLDIRVGRGPDEMRKLATEGERLPDYASGVAFPERGRIFLTLTAPDTWELVDVSTVLAHEMSHVALHRTVNGHRLPRWFVEGLAIEHAREHSIERVRALWEGTVGGQLLPLADIASAFPAHHHGVNLAYAQSADFVRYLRRQPHGELRMARALAAVRDGSQFEDAMLSFYRAPLATLEREWREELGARYSSWPLLLSGLTVLWFGASLLLVLAYIRTRRRHHLTLQQWEEDERAEHDADAAALSLREQAAPDALDTASAETPLDTPLVRHDVSGVPTIEYRGEQHTLH